MKLRGGLGLLLVVALAGCGSSSPDKTATHDAFQRGYRQGLLTGHTKAAAAANARVLTARHSGYADGFTDGAAVMTPPHVGKDLSYIVTYRAAAHGWTLGTWLKMPLETTWRCPSLQTCDQLIGGATDSGYHYSTAPAIPYTPEPTLPTYPATTQNYGSGNGYPVVCADGTLSDSGGIQGACSHHGGEP